MNTETTQINYCGQKLVFEKVAYTQFEQYEKELKVYFFNQTDGQEIFEDLQYRICEMLQSRMVASGGIITEEDIAFVKQNIGQTNELNDEENLTAQDPEAKEEKKKLYRDVSNKMIAGVSSGLGNYFAIDPTAFRILFIISSLFTSGLGILIYIVLWIVLKPAHLIPNYTKRLFRNNNDKVIAGICGGLASFFNIESWVVRVLFISPILLNIIADGMMNWNVSIFNGSAIGFSIITYMVLWITTKEAETNSEEMLARGTKININSISQTAQKAQKNPDRNSGLNTLLRIIAFIVIGIVLIVVVVFLAGFSFTSLFMYPMTNAVLNTQMLKWLGVLSLCFFILLPFVAVVVWVIRRIAGYKGPHKFLRLIFGSLWALGLASSITLTILLTDEMNTKSSVEQRMTLPVVGDTLYVKKLDDRFLKIEGVGNESIIQNFYGEDDNIRRSHLISFNRQISPNDSFYMRTKIIALGRGLEGAQENARAGSFRSDCIGNEIFVSKFVSIPRNMPYRFQHAEITFYVPKGKNLIMDKSIKQIRIRRNHIQINNDFDWDDGVVTEINMDNDLEELKDGIDEVYNEIGMAKEEIKSELEKAKKETQTTIRIEKQKLKLKEEELKLKQLEAELGK